jgi:hypothetical protein
VKEEFLSYFLNSPIFLRWVKSDRVSAADFIA